LDSNPAFGDLDGDGDFDFATGNAAGSSRIQYYENVGSALLPEFVARVGSANPFDKVQVAEKSAPRFSDLDGDNDPDLVLGDGTGRLTLYENKQQGKSFATPKFSEIAGTASPLGSVDVDLHETGAAYSAPTLLDLEGDGDLDVVVGHRITSLDGVGELSTAELRTLADTDTLIFYENIGSAEAPEFVQRTGSWSPFGFVDARGYSAAAFGDLDQDGDLDLVLGAEGSLLYYENAGSPVTAFLARQAWANPLSADVLATGSERRFEGLTYINPAFGDLDGDGDLDVVVGADSGLYYYENTGTAAFPIFNLTKGFFDDVVVDVGAPSLVDLDGDLDFDLVVGNCTTPPRARTSVGSCYVGVSESLCDVEQGLCSAQGGEWYLPGHISSSSGCCFCYGGCDRSLETGTDCHTQQPDYSPCENDDSTTDANGYTCSSRDDVDPHCDWAGDFDDNDFTASEQCCACGGGIAFITGVGKLSYFENIGTANVPQFVRRVEDLNPFRGVRAETCFRPTFGDIQKDGDLDLLLGDSHGTLLYYENNGNATAPEFIARTGGANPFASVDVNSQSAPALFDADGDGDLDLAVGTANGTIVYYKNTGTAELPVYNLAVSPFVYVDAYANSAPAFGDLNNDGSPELLVGGINAYDQGSCFYYENATSEFVARTAELIRSPSL
jgi:hypothetical protein